jgi:bacillithiol biosynthesis deacetylase BshB1
LLDLTLGELGTRGSAALRTKEAAEAAAFLGVTFREQLDLGDGFFEHNKQSLSEIIKIIRYCQPEIVLCNALSDRHPDHGRAAKLAADACFLAGLPKIPTTFKGEQQPQWRPKAIYHYIQDHQLQPDFVTDITPFMEKKMQAILKYKSQFYSPDEEENAAKTPISGKEFLEFMFAKARVFGRSVNVEFGEGFNVARPIGVKDLFDLF